MLRNRLSHPTLQSDQYISLILEIISTAAVGNAFRTHKHITEQTKILPYPSPLHFSCAQSVVLYAQTQHSFYLTLTFT